MRVALVTGPDPGHLIPVAGTAAQLRDAGHEPVVVTSERWAGPLDRDGMTFLPLPLIAPTPDDHDLAHRLYVRPAEMAGPLAASLRGLGLDLVVTDTLTRAGGLAAGILDLPWAELIPHPLPDPSVALPPFGTGWAPRPGRDRRYAARTAASRALGEQQKHAALADAGLVDVPPVHRLVATLPALEPPRPDWPPATTMVVPPTWEPSDTELGLPPGTGPLVLVVGTTASATATAAGAADLLSFSVAALAQARRGRGARSSLPQLSSPRASPAPRAAQAEPHRVASPRFGPALGGLPAWAVAGPGRLAPLLAAAAVTVSTGGHGMVVASLRAGVPLVLLPGPGDQKEIAARAARVGAAVQLRSRRPRALLRAVEAMLTPSAQRAAETAGSVRDLALPVPILEAAAR